MSVLRDYKPGMVFPGGVAEKGESPKETAIREVEEEIGIGVSEIKIMAVVFTRHPFDSFRFVFDGGKLSEKQQGLIKLSGEISKFEWLEVDEFLDNCTADLFHINYRKTSLFFAVCDTLRAKYLSP